MLSYRELDAIRQEDPDGGDTEPTEADYSKFEEWVTATFGPDALSQYRSNWDGGRE